AGCVLSGRCRAGDARDWRFCEGKCGMSDGVTVTAEFTFKPGEAEPFAASLADMLKDTARQPGFRDIKVVRHKEDANRFLFIETWDSEAHYHTYIAWRTERGDMERLGRSITGAKVDFWPHREADVRR